MEENPAGACDIRARTSKIPNKLISEEQNSLK